MEPPIRIAVGSSAKQIAEAIRTAVGNGTIRPGQKLPSVRSWAVALAVSHDTVSQAYKLLQSYALLEPKVGSGTAIADPLPGQFGYRILREALGQGPLHNYESISESSNIRSFASNVLDPRLFRADAFLAELREVQTLGHWAFYYAPPQGDLGLRHEIAAWLKSLGTPATPENIVVTLGVQQALTLVGRLLLKSGDILAIEGADHLGGVQRWASLGVTRHIVSRRDGEAPDISKLRSVNAKALYVAPTGCGASGRVLDLAQREALLELKVPIIEDASNSWICYGDRPPDLAALSSQVIQVGSFANVLAPGIRVGYILANVETCNALTRLQQVETAGLSLPLQVALASLMRKGFLRSEVKRLTARYSVRRKAMLSALSTYFPRTCSWSIPEAGFACRVRLPDTIDTQKLYEQAVERGVAFTPGSMLFNQEQARNNIRVCFGTQDPEGIREGMRVLGQLVSVNRAV